MKKVGMVLEGGSMRGMFTAGVLDVLMENNIEIDGIIGTSAGALIGVNYFSKQVGRVIRYNKKYCNDKRYISLSSLAKTGNIVNKEFTFYKVTKELDPFDNDAFIKSGKDFYATATDIESGKTEYFKINNVIEQLEEFRASSAMPFASEIIEINNKKYLDGGITDSIPLDKCLDLGYDKIVVILTQPLDYKKEPLDRKTEQLLKVKFRKYPNLIDAMLNRYKIYNDTIEKIKKMEENKEIFVIRPSCKLDITIVNNTPRKIQQIYDFGVEAGQKNLEPLIEYLNK